VIYIKLFENFSTNSLFFEFGLLLKLDEETKTKIKSIQIPDGLFPLHENELHITLTSKKNCEAISDILRSKLPTLSVSPKIKLGETCEAFREEVGKHSFVVALDDNSQQKLKELVDDVYSQMGLENPEPKRYFHITIANNVESPKLPGFGNPLKSIGDITKTDFDLYNLN
jgi:hypothetical protein